MGSTQEPRVILIGGTSHAGKSTLAQTLAVKLGWECRSTDKLARHPGRPWAMPPKVVPEHVAAHYLSLGVDELMADVLRHYRANVWPQVEKLVADQTGNAAAAGLVMEGSALWPEWVAKVKSDRVAAIWLTANDEFLAQRIRRDSDYEAKAGVERAMIDKFIGRTLRYNTEMMELVERLDLVALEAGRGTDAAALTEQCLTMLRGDR